MRIDTLYFKEGSPKHTSQVIAAVKQFLISNSDIEHIVVATTEGKTAIAFSEEFRERNVIAVTHQDGFANPGMNELSDEKRKLIEGHGAIVHTATHAFAGVSRGIRMKLGTYSITEILAYAFRTFGQGTKVCAEIAMMAADAGLVPVDQDILCIGGTGRGADTAWIVQAVHTNNFGELKMKACICKPLMF